MGVTTSHSSTVARLAQQGYLRVESLGVTDDELARAGTLLDGVFDRFSTLPPELAHDLGQGTREQPQVPEVLDVSTIEPRLRRTAVFAAAHRLARELLGPDAYLTYDHAIYKPPGRSAPTAWHQDSGYDEVLDHGLAIWVPFQHTDVVDGCMRYVPASHLGGRIPHLTRTGSDGKLVKHLEVADGDAVDVPCPRGGATVHDFHLVHGAGSNLGEQVRRAWILDFSTAPTHRRALRHLKQAVSTGSRRLRGR